MDRLRKRIGKDRLLISGWSGIQDPFYQMELARSAFDLVTLDMQHGMQTEDSIIRTIAAVGPSGKPLIVRIPVGRFELASKFLDAGAHGIIAPMINTVDDAKALASFSKYIPVGDRSFGASQAAGIFGVAPVDYVRAANKNTVVLAMIETRQAVDNMEAIADVDGIDGLFCGPGDLSISIRQNVVPDAYGPDTIEIVERIASVAKQRGKIAGAWCGTADHLNLVQKFGYDYASLGHDSLYLKEGINTLLAKLEF